MVEVANNVDCGLKHTEKMLPVYSVKKISEKSDPLGFIPREVSVMHD